MIRYGTRTQFLAAGLSALAGYVDAIGFIKLGGFFVSFMSGNTTRFGVGVAESINPALIAGGLIVTFVLGVMLGTLTAHIVPRRREAAVLSLVSLLLVVAASAGALGLTAMAIVAMALAMGAENAVFAENGDVHIGLTYMTGTLVKLGQRLVGLLLGKGPANWQPYLLLWLGLASGAVLGALAYPHLDLQALWIAAGAAALFALLTWSGKFLQ